MVRVKNSRGEDISYYLKNNLIGIKIMRLIAELFDFSISIN